MLQPIVENAIVHGLENKISKGIIQIAITKEQENIRIVVQDNGIGMDEETLSLVNREIKEGIEFDDLGIGIENVRKRLYLSYGNQFKWSLTSEVEVGTKVDIFIPYKEG